MNCSVEDAWPKRAARLYRWISLLSSVLLTASVPICPHNGSVPDYDRSAPLNNLGNGYDPTQKSTNGGVQQPVISLTESSARLNLASQPSITVPIPCEAKNNYGSINGQIDGDNVVVESIKKLRQEENDKGVYSVGLNGLALSGAFSRAETQLLTSKHVSVYRFRSFVLGFVDLPITHPTQQQRVRAWWSDDFEDAFTYLNTTHWTDDSYANLIETFGTHVISKAVLGGFITVQGVADYCDFEKLESKSTSVAEKELLADLDISGNNTARKEERRSTYVSNTHISAQGGDLPTFQKTYNIDDYLGRKMPNGVAVMAKDGSLLEIWKLLPVGDSRRGLLELAVTEYLERRQNISSTAAPVPACSSSSSDDAGKIAGGVVGGFFFLVIVVGCLILRAKS